MFSLGLDIGTTTICGIVVDSCTGDVLESLTRANTGFIPSDNAWEKIQDPAVILSVCRDLVSELTGRYPVDAIGLTGQMHGIVYVGADGQAVSPLVIWQDGRGDLEYRGGRTYAQTLSALTGYPMATGYGLTTQFYQTVNRQIPTDAVCCCTIHDYVAAQLCGLWRPVTHASDAASFGMFDNARGCFDTGRIAAAGMDTSLLPEVVPDFAVLGQYGGRIPVCAAIGDNQASFLGSVNEENAALVNVGTGSQISVGFGGAAVAGGLEARPLYANRSILVGCALCGGRAYALLQKFFSSVVEMATGESCGELYGQMDRELQKLSGATTLEFETFFSGTRDNPARRARIGNLGEQNFTPADFIAGVLHGMTDELYGYYETAVADGACARRLVGSGNGLRKNPALQRIVSERFGMPLLIPEHTEEAAFGAALCAMVGCGAFSRITDAQKIIRYTQA